MLHRSTVNTDCLAQKWYVKNKSGLRCKSKDTLSLIIRELGLSLYLFIYLFTYLFIYVCIYLFVYFFADSSNVEVPLANVFPLEAEKLDDGKQEKEDMEVSLEDAAQGINDSKKTLIRR